MSYSSPNLNLPLIAPSQAQKHVTHNEAILRLDGLAQLVILELEATAPPAAPAEGATYDIASDATGIWAGQGPALATWLNNGWIYSAPQPGWQAYCIATGDQRIWDGTAWAASSPSLLSELVGIGVGTVPDDINRLSIASPASLFSHSGSDHRVVLNKAQPEDTASLLYQSNWSGRAEIGLAGNDDLSVKVSADGSTFTEALRIYGDSGVTGVKGLNSGVLSVDDDAVDLIVPPTAAGFLLITVVGATGGAPSHSAILAYDVGSSPDLVTLMAAADFSNRGTTSLSGTIGTSGQTSVSALAGSLQIENRRGVATRYCYTFVCGA
ncbi:MAG: DUF2793 domain-containing protein [Paracoccaceae bacterium]